MKTRKLLFGICLSLLLPALGIPLFAQMDNPPPQDPPLRKEKVEVYKIAFLTERLNLTPAEAQKFWPVYNEFETKRQDLQKAMREKIKQFRETDEITEKQALEIIDAEIARQQSEVDLTKDFFTKLKTVISPQKIVILGKAEREFKEVLLRRLAEQRNPRIR